MRFAICVVSSKHLDGGGINIQSSLSIVSDVKSQQEALGIAIEDSNKNQPEHTYSHHTILEIEDE